MSRYKARIREAEAELHGPTDTHTHVHAADIFPRPSKHGHRDLHKRSLWSVDPKQTRGVIWPRPRSKNGRADQHPCHTQARSLSFNTLKESDNGDISQAAGIRETNTTRRWQRRKCTLQLCHRFISDLVVYLLRLYELKLVGSSIIVICCYITDKTLVSA